MRIHFIAIGGAVMHNLALAMQRAGHVVTGSDDVLNDPSRTRLKEAGLLPAAEGWFPEKLDAHTDLVVLGMHARPDNPELKRAQELKLPLMSYPQLLLEHGRNKQRIAIAGSHGKTTVTAMVMHVLEAMKRPFDYLVGARIPGFEQSVRLSADAPVLLLEADEYPASPLDNRPKAVLYEPHLLVLTGLAWDHVNVYPTEEAYIKAFEDLLNGLPKGGACIHYDDDKRLRKLVKHHTDRELHYIHPYSTPKARAKGGEYAVRLGKDWVPVQVYGRHNLSNIMAAYTLCTEQLAVPHEAFVQHIGSFQGAARRLEEVLATDRHVIIRDFAHAPSKVQASVEAVAQRYENLPLVAALELHTFSSLTPEFLPQFAHSLKGAQHKLVFVDEQALLRKKMRQLTAGQIRKAFAEPQLEVFTSAPDLLKRLQELARAKANPGQRQVFLLMSSGAFGGMELTQIVKG